MGAFFRTIKSRQGRYWGLGPMERNPWASLYTQSLHTLNSVGVGMWVGLTNLYNSVEYLYMYRQSLSVCVCLCNSLRYKNVEKRESQESFHFNFLFTLSIWRSYGIGEWDPIHPSYVSFDKYYAIYYIWDSLRRNPHIFLIRLLCVPILVYISSIQL